MLRSLFWNREEHRLAAIWRVLIQLVLTVVLVNVWVFALVRPVALSVYGEIPTEMAADPEGLTLLFIIDEVVGTVLMVAAVWVAARFLDRRRPGELGLRFDRRAWMDLAFGLGLGGLLMTGIFVVEFAAGWVTVTGYMQAPHLPGYPFAFTLIPKVMMVLGVGIREEILSRGYHLTNIAEGLANWRGVNKLGAVLLATVLSSAVFGLLHGLNPNATFASTLFVVVGGVMLSTGYILTGKLGVSIGLHLSWNFFQGTVFGWPVSGLTAHPSAFVMLSQQGPELWTGGSFGPEGGLLGLLAMLAGIALTVAWVRWAYGDLRVQTHIAEPELRSWSAHRQAASHADAGLPLEQSEWSIEGES